MEHADADGDGRIDADEWKVATQLVAEAAPYVPNPGVFYSTMPDGASAHFNEVAPAGATEFQGSQLLRTKTPSQPEFRETARGIVPGYTGHVPRAHEKVGGAHVGRVPGTPERPNEPGVGYSQGNTEDYGDSGRYVSEARAAGNDYLGASARDPKPSLHGAGVLPGYSGHVPNAARTVGQSSCASANPALRGAY